MSNVPPGAQVSEDGYYWWDGNQWQLIDREQTSATGSSGIGASASTTADPANQAASASDGTGWPPSGYPADPSEWSQEQLQYWFGYATDQSEDRWIDQPSQITVSAIEGTDQGVA